MKLYNYAKNIKHNFQRSCKFICVNLEQFVKNSETNFTRNRVLTPLDIILFMFQLSSHSMGNELLKNKLNISRQGFVEALNKLKVDAFQLIFNKSLTNAPRHNRFHGYPLLAVDGTYFNFFNKKNKKKTFLCVMMYDVLNNYYNDIRMSSTIFSEIAQCIDMIKSITTKSIFVMDRGYSSVNLITHLINRNQYFVIRTKDIYSTGILRKCKFDNRSFDEMYTFRLTRSQKLKDKQLKGYRFISTHFDFINEKDTSSIYDLTLRIVRFKLPSGKYETLLTNLPKTFTVDDIKEIYHLRWQIETSFRNLKHTLATLFIHFKTQENIEKEIYTKISLYNYIQIIKNQNDYQNLLENIIKQKQTKYCYNTNFSRISIVVKMFLFQDDLDEKLFLKGFIMDKVPIRENRTRDPNINILSVPIKSFNYRCA